MTRLGRVVDTGVEKNLTGFSHLSVRRIIRSGLVLVKFQTPGWFLTLSGTQSRGTTSPFSLYVLFSLFLIGPAGLSSGAAPRYSSGSPRPRPVSDRTATTGYRTV